MKLKEQVLTIEQAKHLQSLGLDMSDAAHSWYRCTRDRYGNQVEKGWWSVRVNPIMVGLLETSEEIPTYTLQEVLGKLPKKIVIDDKPYHFYIEFPNDDVYEVGYSHCFDCDGETIFEEDFFMAAHKLLCWVVENGYLKEEKK